MRLRRGTSLDERGAVLVEAAIMIPLVILLTFGAIEMGFAYNEQGTIRAATRTAARAASGRPCKRRWPTCSRSRPRIRRTTAASS